MCVNEQKALLVPVTGVYVIGIGDIREFVG